MTPKSPVAVTRRRAAKGPPTPESSHQSVRLKMIAEAAYYRAERRAFAPGGELDDWVAAEAEIDRILGQGT